ncbi:MAG: phosphorylase [Nodosilinea sp.]
MSRLDHSSDRSIHTVLVPQGAEHRAVQAGCRRANPSVVVVPLPLGQAAGDALGRWLADHPPPLTGGYLLVGLGGGLAPDLRVGDRVLCDRALMPQTGTPLTNYSFDNDLTVGIHQRLPGLVLGTAVGSDRIITQAEEKRHLHQRYGAAVVDMESPSVLRTLRSYGANLAMVRVISDDSRHNLPDITRAINPDGSLRPLALAAQFGQAPVAAGRLIIGSLRGLATLETLMFQLFQASPEALNP